MGVYPADSSALFPDVQSDKLVQQLVVGTGVALGTRTHPFQKGCIVGVYTPFCWFGRQDGRAISSL